MEYGDQLVVVCLIVLRLSGKGDVAYLQKNTKMRKLSAYKWNGKPHLAGLFSGSGP